MNWTGRKVRVRNLHNDFYTVGKVTRHETGTGVVEVVFERGEQQTRPVDDIELLTTIPCHCLCHEDILSHASRCVCNGGWGYL